MVCLLVKAFQGSAFSDYFTCVSSTSKFTLYVKVTHQQVFSQLSHGGCSLCWLRPIGSQFYQCRQEVLTFIYILQCLLPETQHILLMNKVMFHLWITALYAITCSIFILITNKRWNHFGSELLQYEQTPCSTGSFELSTTYFAHCYCGNCGPSCLAESPGGHCWYCSPNWALRKDITITCY